MREIKSKALLMLSRCPLVGDLLGRRKAFPVEVISTRPFSTPIWTQANALRSKLGKFASAINQKSIKGKTC